MADPVIVRRLGPDEWAEWRALRLRALATNPEAFSTTFQETVSRPPEQWQQALEEAAGNMSVMLVVEVGGRPVGMVRGQVEQAEDIPFAWLASMWIDPAYRNMGLAQRLAEAIVHWARERSVCRVQLLVAPENVGALKLYGRLGFQPDGDVMSAMGRVWLRMARSLDTSSA
jgi:ribosomal protein S18 acetylase RimI-like enzyme